MYTTRRLLHEVLQVSYKLKGNSGSRKMRDSAEPWKFIKYLKAASMIDRIGKKQCQSNPSQINEADS
jgi:hypothetical protein